MTATDRLKSTWTPSYGPTNDKLFDERRNLVNKWFDRWNDPQRKKVIQDIVTKCKNNQLSFAEDEVIKRLPREHVDFATKLPRAVSLYVFSFLDPRTLCRCAKVSWYWRYLTEQDSLWTSKCLKFNWTLPFKPSPFESGVWKRFYIQRVKELHYLQPREPSKLYNTEIGLEEEARSQLKAVVQVPWRNSDSKPKDTWRYNYFDNDGRPPTAVKPVRSSTPSHASSGTHTNRPGSAQSRRSQSYSSLVIKQGSRPDWARNASLVDSSSNLRPPGTRIPELSGTDPAVARPPAPVVRTRPPSYRPTASAPSRGPNQSESFVAKPWPVSAGGGPYFDD